MDFIIVFSVIKIEFNCLLTIIYKFFKRILLIFDKEI